MSDQSFSVFQTVLIGILCHSDHYGKIASIQRLSLPVVIAQSFNICEEIPKTDLNGASLVMVRAFGKIFRLLQSFYSVIVNADIGGLGGYGSCLGDIKPAYPKHPMAVNYSWPSKIEKSIIFIWNEVYSYRPHSCHTMPVNHKSIDLGYRLYLFCFGFLTLSDYFSWVSSTKTREQKLTRLRSDIESEWGL